MVTKLEAYDALRVFLEAWRERGGKASDDIAVLRSSTQGCGKGGPLDPARWGDWRNAVESVVKHAPMAKGAGDAH